MTSAVPRPLVCRKVPSLPLTRRPLLLPWKSLLMVGEALPGNALLTRQRLVEYIR